MEEEFKRCSYKCRTFGEDGKYTLGPQKNKDWRNFIKFGGLITE